jgi:hypothetical protein
MCMRWSTQKEINNHDGECHTLQIQCRRSGLGAKVGDEVGRAFSTCPLVVGSAATAAPRKVRLSPELAALPKVGVGGPGARPGGSYSSCA